MLDGFEPPPSAWERAVLPARLDRYEPPMLDMLCLPAKSAGRASRLSSRRVLAARCSRRRRSRCSCASTADAGGAANDARRSRADGEPHARRSTIAAFARRIVLRRPRMPMRPRRPTSSGMRSARLVACGARHLRRILWIARARVDAAADQPGDRPREHSPGVGRCRRRAATTCSRRAVRAAGAGRCCGATGSCAAGC